MIALCLIACGVLMYAEYRELMKLRRIAKLVASTSFVVIGARAFGGGPFQTAMVIGLVFGALGDLALLGKGTRWFLIGLIAFLAGHIAYIVGLAQLESPLYWFIYAGRYGTLALVCGTLALSWLWPNLGAFKIPVVVYVLAIVIMLFGAFAAYTTGALPDPQRTYLALGAALFFVSDLAVARERFIARGFTNKLWGLPAYFVAQLLIASSIQ